MKKIIIYTASACFVALTFTSTVSRADDQTTPNYIPSQTTVAILPTVDESGADDPNDDTSIAKSTLTTEFSSHGFSIVDDSKVTAAIANLKIDLTDDEQQKRATLYQIGNAVGANLVVFEVVTDKQQKVEENWLGDARVGLAKIKIWLVDDNKEQPILSAKVVDGKDKGRYYMEHDGRYLATHAIPNATEAALKDFLSQYPTVSTAPTK
jgi:hypothetical protein